MSYSAALAPRPRPGRDWLGHFHERLPRISSLMMQLVTMESPSDDAERVSQLGRWIRDELRAQGLTAETVRCSPRGDAVVAQLGDTARNGRPRGTLILGHHDTVWPVGTLAALPFKIENDRATGPGVFDMKGGIAVAMAVLETLAREPAPPPVTLLLAPDEEVRSLASRALTVDIARQHQRVLVLEPSLEGAAKVARKGAGFFTLRFSGRSAHAGLDPEKGASALAELARCVLFLEGLNNRDLGTSVVPTVAQAGSTINVVPEAATLSVDSRTWSLGEIARIESAVRGYRPQDPAVRVEVEGGYDRPPLEETPASKALYRQAQTIAADLGFTLGAARVGGGSDGNLTAAAGVPTLDGLGPRGDGAHARHEHVVVSDLPCRAALLTRLVLEQG